MDQVRVDGDGHIRLIVSTPDPGVANWLDAAGRREGIILFRNFHVNDVTIPSTQVVKLSALRSRLPDDTAMVTPDERGKMLAARRATFLKLLGE
jgi:hypothetical protein